MVLIVLERVTPSVRGDLTRWLLEVRPGVFVGNVSAMVRERLWRRVEERMQDGAGALIYRADTEQGFAIQTLGDRRYQSVDYEGLTLIRRT